MYSWISEGQAEKGIKARTFMMCVAIKNNTKKKVKFN